MKLLKQLIKVLDENGIQVNKLNIVEENKAGFPEIEVNEEITIENRDGVYALYINEGKLSPTNYYSLTEALEVLSDYLNRVKIGDVLVSDSGATKLKIVSYLDNDLCNLLDIKTNSLFYSKGVSLKYLYETYIKDGSLHVK